MTNNKKKRVGIVTMRGEIYGENYGNRLQNYALQSGLKKIGCQVETLKNPWSLDYKLYIDILKWLKIFIKGILNYRDRAEFNRAYKFLIFDKKYIYDSKFWLNKNSDRRKVADYYDLFICGSDQIWSPDVPKVQGRWYADFANTRKRCSYAASFGVDYIPKHNIEDIKIFLQGMREISVREESGVELVRSVANRVATRHIDPVFLLDRNEWTRIEKKPKGDFSSDYLLTFFLGGTSDNRKRCIEKLKETHDIVNVVELNEATNIQLYAIDPCEFIYLLHHAKCICTDSFHVTAFACIFNICFYSFNRYNSNLAMKTRITELLHIVGLEEQLIKEETINLPTMYEIDWDSVNCIIEHERRKGVDYLRNIVVAD